MTNPDHRGLGLIDLLLREIIEVAKHCGLTRLESELNGERTTALKSLGAMGFEELVRLPDYIQVLQEANAALPAPYRLAQVDELTGILAKARQRLQDQGIPPDRYPDLPRVVCDLREERMIRFALERWRISMGEVMKSSGVTAN